MNDMRAHPGVFPATVDPAAAAQPRLVSAAHEFEATMMKELMAPLEPGHEALEGGADEGSSSALSSFAAEALGKAISEHGGLGIAKSILHQLTAPSPRFGNRPAPGSVKATPPNSPSALLK